MNLFTKQKQTHRFTERTYGYRGEGVGGGIIREFGIDKKKLQITISYICNLYDIVHQLYINKKESEKNKMEVI